MLLVTWLLSVLAMAESDSLMARVKSIKFQQKRIATVEPLIHFPFIHSLANPCDFQTDKFDSSEDTSLVSLGDLIRNGEIPLTQQVLDFLNPFRHLIDVQSVESSRDPIFSNDIKMKEQLSQELKLVVSQVLHLIHIFYSPSELKKCNGHHLKSLPRENVFVVSSKGEILLGELYRSLMIIAAHLHVMIHDVHDSARFCPLENVAHLQMLQQLIGKVKTSMCLMLQSAVWTEREENHHMEYFRVTHEVLQSFFHRFYYCATREIRECLVINYTDEIFSFLQRYIDY